MGSVDKSVIESLRREAAGHASETADLRQELSELTSKFSVKEKQVADLTAELAAVKGRLELAQVNLDQLRSAAETTEAPSGGDEDREKAIKVSES